MKFQYTSLVSLINWDSCIARHVFSQVVVFLSFHGLCVHSHARQHLETNIPGNKLTMYVDRNPLALIILSLQNYLRKCSSPIGSVSVLLRPFDYVTLYWISRREFHVWLIFTLWKSQVCLLSNSLHRRVFICSFEIMKEIQRFSGRVPWWCVTRS